MSALSEIDFSTVATQYGELSTKQDIPPEIVNAVKREVASLFWAWYHVNEDRKVAHVHVWFFSRDIFVKDLHDAFVLLFGPEDLTGYDTSGANPSA